MSYNADIRLNQMFFCSGLNVLFYFINKKFKKLRVSFGTNAYANWFIDKVMNDFETQNNNNTNNNDKNNSQPTENDFCLLLAYRRLC